MGWVVNATPRPLCPRERPSTHCIECWVGPTADQDTCGKCRLHRDSCSCAHMYILHVYMCVRMYLCMYVLTYVCVVCMYIHMYVCTGMHVCTYVCMYVCMYVYDGIPQNSIWNAQYPEFLHGIKIRHVTLRTNILIFPPGWKKTCTLLGQP
jgi:hypothetical protein